MHKRLDCVFGILEGETWEHRIG